MPTRRPSLPRTPVLVALTATWLASATLAPAVRADDAKIMNGGFCTPTVTTSTAVLNRFASITNLSGHEVQVACPVVRDRRRSTGALADGNAAAIVVSVDGRGTDVRCMVESHSELGQLLDQNSRRGGAAGPTTLVLPIEHRSTNGYYALQCVLPDQGRLFAYRLVEPTPTEDD